MQPKVLIVDFKTERYRDCFTPLKTEFASQISTSKTAGDGSRVPLDLSEIDMAIIHENNKYSDSLIQKAKGRNVHIIAFTGGLRPQHRFDEDGRVLHVGYDNHIAPNLRDFLVEYFGGRLNFKILTHGKKAAVISDVASKALHYKAALETIRIGLDTAFDKGKPETFLNRSTGDCGEDNFDVMAKRILQPDFQSELESYIGVKLDSDTFSLLIKFAEILLAPDLRLSPPEGNFYCGDHSCGDCFLCEIKYAEGKKSPYYELKEKLSAFLKKV
jgi:hypothetical protein